MDVLAESGLGANITAWLPLKKTDKVCYIGEMGPAAEKLQEMAGEAACIPPSEDNLPADGYDYIICLGSLEQEKWNVYYQCLKETGKLILAFDNAYGLRYLAGTKESASGEYFGSIEDVKASQSRTKEEVLASLAAAGFVGWQFFYPFPDWRLAMSIYSDDYLPKQGELIDQTGNFDSERLVLFDEAKAWDAAVARGKFKEFANSYLIVAGKKPDIEIQNEKGEAVSFVKFSNDRGKRFNIRTYITKSPDGKRHLLKTADCAEAEGHIRHLADTAEKLQESYADTRFCVNTCTVRPDGAELEFVDGYTIEEELDRLLEQGRQAEAEKKIFEVFDEIKSCRSTVPFTVTEEFKKVFGNVNLPEGLMASPVSDIDMIMPNILVGETGSWTVIDYEWTFSFPVPLHFILYRCIHYYADTTAFRRILKPDALYEKAGITEQEKEAYAAMEEAFQAYVLDGHVPVRRLYIEKGKPAYHISSILHVADELERRRALQVYFDRGAGFSEADTAVYHSKALDGTYHLEIPVSGDVVRLRIDPGSQACTAELERLSFKQEKTEIRDFISNGHKLSGSLYLFDTDDPNILLENLPAGDKILLLDMRIDSMSLKAAEWIAPKIDAKYRLKKILKK